MVVLIVVGPNNLPQFARSAGRLYGQIRRTAEEMRRSLVLEADRQDAEKRYEEMLERRRRAEEERKKAEAAQPGVAAQDEHLPGAPAEVQKTAPDLDDALAQQAHGAGSDEADEDPLAFHRDPSGDEEFDAFLHDPSGPYGAGQSVDDLMRPSAGSTSPDVMTGQALPPGVTAEEWAELPDHIKDLLRQRGGQA